MVGQSNMHLQLGQVLFSGDVTNLSGSLAPGQYYLVQLAGGTTVLHYPYA